MESRGKEKRAVVRQVLEGEKPPYVPWSMGFTERAAARLREHYAGDDLEEPLGNHLLKFGREGGYVFAPAHDVEGDVPLENILAAIEVVQAQETGVRT